MKKGLLKITATLTAALAIFAMSGCSTLKSKKAMTAYEIAVKHGFVGTEEEWLKSLECDDHEDGLSAYQIAVQNGFMGTEEEWLASLKGLDGDDGQDLDINAMYEAAKAEGFQGSMSDFLKEYFNVEVSPNNDTEQLAHNVMSSVSIICVFNRLGTENEKAASTGSGVIYHLEKENGRAYIITNYHVVFEKDVQEANGVSNDIYVYLHGAKNAFTTLTYTDESGSPMKARFVGGSRENDVAVLAIENDEYLKTSAAEAVKIREESNPITLGEKVYVIGNAAGRGISVSDGVISVESEYISLESLIDTTQLASHRVMRTDAVVNRGNSGGGLFDAEGELVGIVNAKSNSTTLDNVGYAIPIEKVCDIADEVIATGNVNKGLLGVTLQVDTSSAKIDENGRLVVTERIIVSEQSENPEHSSYNVLKNGDVIKKVTVDGETREITRLYQVSEWLIRVEEGDTITIEFEREGVTMTETITFEAKHILSI